MQNVVDNVATGLKEKGFDVFEYRRSSIETGQRWRYGLLVALLLCDSAAVLLDDRAPTRRWVHYEMEILKVRRILEPEFALMTIEIKPTTDTALVVENLSLSLAKGGSVSTGDDFETSLMSAIDEYSEVLDDDECKTCIEALVVERRIWQHFRGLEPAIAASLLEGLQHVPAWEGSDIHWAALDALDRALGTRGTDRASEVGHDIGRAIVRRGLHAVPSVLNYTSMRAEAELRDIVDSLTPLMIPLRQVRPLADLFSRDSAQRGPYVVTGTSTKLVVAAIRRAWGVERGPSYQAPIFLAEPLGEDDPAAYLSLFYEQIRGYAGFSHEDNISDSELMRLAVKAGILPPIQTIDQNAALAFLVISGYPFHEEMIDQVQKTFPDLVIIFTLHHDELHSPKVVNLGAVGSRNLDLLVRYTEHLLRRTR
jgi:hypothetical protein